MISMFSCNLNQMKLQSIIGWGFSDIWKNQGQGKCYQSSRRPRLIALTEILTI